LAEVRICSRALLLNKEKGEAYQKAAITFLHRRAIDDDDDDDTTIEKKNDSGRCSAEMGRRIFRDCVLRWKKKQIPARVEGCWFSWPSNLSTSATPNMRMPSQMWRTRRGVIQVRKSSFLLPPYSTCTTVPVQHSTPPVLRVRFPERCPAAWFGLLPTCLLILRPMEGTRAFYISLIPHHSALAGSYQIQRGLRSDHESLL
jgi:hypothetical protein